MPRSTIDKALHVLTLTSSISSALQRPSKLEMNNSPKITIIIIIKDYKLCEIIIIIMRGSYIAHFTNVSMRFTTSGGLFRAAYYGALAAEQLTIMRN
jgi:hypothetical protein